MKRLIAVVLACVSVMAARPAAQGNDVTLEYRVKAAYLFNFTKFIEWPASALRADAPLTICVAGANPFGPVLAETVKGETVRGRPLATRVVRDSAGCHVLFVPDGVAAASLLRNARSRPLLTVGESQGFIRQGGVINFVLEQGKVRFEIDQAAAERAGLRISSRLLRLARHTQSTRGPTDTVLADD